MTATAIETTHDDFHADLQPVPPPVDEHDDDRPTTVPPPPPATQSTFTLDLARIPGAPQSVSREFAETLAACGVQLANVRLREPNQQGIVSVGTYSAPMVALTISGELHTFSAGTARELARLLAGSAEQAERDAELAGSEPTVMEAAPVDSPAQLDLGGTEA